MDIEYNAGSPYYPLHAGFWNYPFFYYGERTLKSMAVDVRWDVAERAYGIGLADKSSENDLLQLAPKLARSSVSVQLKSTEARAPYLTIGPNPSPRVINYPFSVDIDRETKETLLKPKPDGQIIGLERSRYIPGRKRISTLLLRRRLSSISIVGFKVGARLSRPCDHCFRAGYRFRIWPML